MVVIEQEMTDTTVTSPPESNTAAPTAASDDESNYLKGFHLVVLCITLMLGQFLTALDATVLTTAIPTITSRFRSLDDVGWYGSAYLFTTTALEPLFGKVYLYFDMRRTFVCAILTLELGSILCAAAVNSPMFIFGRAVAGVGQAAMTAGGMTVIGYQVPLHQRSIFFAVLTSMSGVASVLGPLLGGAFVDTPNLTWRFGFWINLPLGAIVIITGLISFKSPRQEPLNLALSQKLIKMDLPGAIIFIAAMVCLFVGLQRGGTIYSWSDSQAWGLILGFGLIMIVFIAWEIWRGEDALIPPRILSNRSVLACCVYTFLIAIGFSTMTYYLPFYFQSAKGVSAKQSGINLIAFLASITVLELSTGLALLLLGYYLPFMLLGATLFCVGSALLSTLQVSSPTRDWVGYQVLTGAGFGSTLQMAAVAMHSTLLAQDLPVGNAVFLVSNFLGGALGVSIAQNVFVNVLRSQLSALGNQVNAQAIISAGATEISSVVPSNLLPQVVKTYSDAVTKTFLLPTATAGLAFFVTFGVRWHNVRKNNSFS